MSETYIRLFIVSGDALDPQPEDYTPAELGGIVPGVGDVIVDPGVAQGLARDPGNRTVFEVQRRYIQPDNSHGARICLVVLERRGRPDEIEVLGE
jgi:hypothetical protein